MNTTQEGRDRLRRLVDAAKPRYTKAKKKDHPIIKLLDDADELARLRTELYKRAARLRELSDECSIETESFEYLQDATWIEELLNNGEPDENHAGTT